MTEEAQLSTFELGPASLLLDGSAGQQAEFVAPRPGSGPDGMTLLCARCWSTFEGFSKTACPRCQSPKPATGWASMPYTFRGRYVFWRLLGRGGMGAVFLAYDDHQLESARKAVAVKVVPASGSPSLRDTLRRMFEREASAGAMLAQSPFFVRVTSHDIGVDPAYLVMEYVDWPTLRGLLRRGEGKVRPLSPIKVARIGIAALRGVQTMHFHRIVHRDLKPDNIFVRRVPDTDDYEIKILDFGVWTYDASLNLPKTSLPGYTRQDEGSPVGTYAYMSPEQMASRPVGARSDLHALGSVLWELATGKVPYALRGKELHPALRDRMDRLRRPPDRPPSMPEGLYDILAKALEYEPRDRWESADEMKSALKLWLAEETLRTRAMVEDARQRFGVVGAQVDGLLAKLSPARDLGRELEALAERLQAYQRNLDEALPDALRRSIVDVDEKFRALSARLDRFAEDVKRGVEEGEAATGDLSPIVVPPSLPPSVAIDLDEPGDGAEPVRSSAIQERVSAPDVAPPETPSEAPRPRAGLGAVVTRLRLLKRRPSEARPRSRDTLDAGLLGAPPRVAPWRALGAGAALAIVGFGAWAMFVAPEARPRDTEGTPVALARFAAPSASAAPLARPAPRAPDATLEAGPPAAASALAWASRADTFAVASVDGKVRLYDAEGRAGAVLGAALSGLTALAEDPPSGAWWVGTDDGRVALLDAGGAPFVTRVPFVARALVASAHGGEVIAITSEGEVWRVDRAGAPPRRTARLEADALALGGTLERAYVGLRDGRLVELVEGAPARAIAVGAAPLTALAVGSAELAVGDADGGVALVSRERFDAATPRTPHAGAVRGLSFVGDGALWSTGDDQRLVAHAPRGDTTRVIDAAAGPLKLLATSRDGARVVAAARDHSLLLREVSGGGALRIQGRAGGAQALAFGAAGLVVAGVDPRRLEPIRLTRLDTFGGLDVSAVAVSPDGARVALAGRGLTIVEPDGRRVSTDIGGPPLARVAWGPAGLLVADVRGRLARTDVDGRVEARIEAVGGPVRALAVGDGWLVGTQDGVLSRLDGETLEPRARAELGDVVRAVLVDGARVLAGTSDGTLHELDGASLAARARHALVGGSITALALDTSGVLYVGGADGRVRALARGALDATPRIVSEHGEAVSALIVVGGRLHVGSADGVVRVVGSSGDGRWEATVAGASLVASWPSSGAATRP
jgi:serine/threonine protein kinase